MELTGIYTDRCIDSGYSKALIQQLPTNEGLRFSKDNSRSNLIYVRLFCIRDAISETASHLLS
jgi:hypothetical protein